MKIVRLFILIVILFSTLPIKAQNTKFDSTPISNDIKSFNNVQAKTIEWAENIKKMNHLNDDYEIYYRYVINASDTLNYRVLRNCIKLFVGRKPIERELVDVPSSNDKVSVVASLGCVAQNDGIMKFGLYVTVIPVMVFDFKPNRIRITITVDKYQYGISAIGLATHTDPGVWAWIYNVPPFKKSENKKTWSSAFINTNAGCINLANEFVTLLNNNYDAIAQKLDKKDKEELNDNNW